MRTFTVKPIDEMETINHGITKLAGAELGVESFGMQVFDFEAGFTGYPKHDHSLDGQEEVYIVLRGSAEFEVEGEHVSVNPERMLWVGAGSKRELTPGPNGVRILVIGATPGRPYERAEAFQLSSR